MTRRVPIGPRTYYARRHTFTLDSPGWVTIDLRGDPARQPPLDLYLIVLDGHTTDGSGTVLARNDNIGGGHGTNYRNSRIADLFLQPGNYTIEATTNPQRRTGDYTLAVNATVTGLQAEYDATVGRELRIDFNLGKYHAAATASDPDLTVKAQRTAATGTLRLTAGSTRDRTITLAFTTPTAASRGARGSDDAAQQDTAGTYPIRVRPHCGDDQYEHPEHGTCEWDEDELEDARGERYLVTPALLDGVYRVANRVVSARDAECAMTPTQLAALMLSIGVWEANPLGEFDVPRSLMFVSRTDNPAQAYAGNVLPTEEAPGAEPKRAFWHPGVGYWQLDIWAKGLNHAERADVDLGGALVAEHLDRAYCGPAGSEQELRKSLYTASWNGCKPTAKNGDGVPIRDSDGNVIRVCFNTFKKIYLGGELGDLTYGGLEGLWVTTATDDDHEFPDNETYTNTKGGVQPLLCRWGDSANRFGCWLYDTDRPEGNLDRWDPEGDGEFNKHVNDPAYRTVMVCPNDADTCLEKEKVPKLVCPNGARTCAEEDKIEARYKFRSPLAAPFVSFTHSSKRFAVFPESFTGGPVTWFKHVPIGKEVRKYWKGTWHQEGYDMDGDRTDDVLKVQDLTRLLSTDPQTVYMWGGCRGVGL